jgi:hypothetical protein
MVDIGHGKTATHSTRGESVEDHIYKKIEIIGTSSQSSDDAIQNAIAKASETVRTLRWFEVAELRGEIAEGRIAHWQATVKIGFRLDAET